MAAVLVDLKEVWPLGKGWVLNSLIPPENDVKAILYNQVLYS